MPNHTHIQHKQKPLAAAAAAEQPATGARDRLRDPDRPAAPGLGYGYDFTSVRVGGEQNAEQRLSEVSGNILPSLGVIGVHQGHTAPQIIQRQALPGLTAPLLVQRRVVCDLPGSDACREEADEEGQEPNASYQPDEAPKASHQSDAEPNASHQPGTEPNASHQPEAESNASRQSDAEPNASYQPGTEPNAFHQPNEEPNASYDDANQTQADPTWREMGNLIGNPPVRSETNPPTKHVIEDQAIYGQRRGTAEENLKTQQARAESLLDESKKNVKDYRYWFAKVYGFVTDEELKHAERNTFYYPSYVMASVNY